MSSTTTKPSFSVKLLIDKKANRVLFAEAGKDFVDFLFSLMSLPIGTVTSLLSPAEMVGSLGKVYESLDNLSDTYVQTNTNKAALLSPNVAALDGVGVAKLISLPGSVADAKTVYHCSSSCRSYVTYVTYDPSESCPSCSRTMSEGVTFVQSKASQAAASSSGSERGYVKDMVTYMVKDDLEVKPMSTISTIALINKYGIREIGDLEETVVSIGVDEGLKLLKASFESKTVLSNVFLGKENDIDIAI